MFCNNVLQTMFMYCDSGDGGGMSVCMCVKTRRCIGDSTLSDLKVYSNCQCSEGAAFDA